MVRVASHRRSGTHFLMACLWRNFEFPDLALEAHADGRLWQDGRRTTAVVPWGRLFLTHELCTPDVDKSELIYILRNPLEVLRSCWEFDGMPGTLNEYATAERIQYWKDHVKSYSGAFIVRYEDLLAFPKRTLRDIQCCFGLRNQSARYEVPDYTVGWLPPKRKAPRDGYNGETYQRFRDILGDCYGGYRLW